MLILLEVGRTELKASEGCVFQSTQAPSSRPRKWSERDCLNICSRKRLFIGWRTPNRCESNQLREDNPTKGLFHIASNLR